MSEEALALDDLPSRRRGAVEAVLMVVDEPLGAEPLALALGLPVAEVETVLRELADDYDREGRGFALRQVAGGWRVFSRPEYDAVVERFVQGGQRARLTQAALETLGIVAYYQPVTRARVSGVRGVAVDGVMRTLQAHGLVDERGTDPLSGAILYGTTAGFLEHLGLESIDDLPALAPFLPEVEALDELRNEGAR